MDKGAIDTAVLLRGVIDTAVPRVSSVVTLTAKLKAKNDLKIVVQQFSVLFYKINTFQRYYHSENFFIKNHRTQFLSWVG
jgi:hypothetical protein